MAESSLEQPRYLGYLEGHRDWVTCIRTPPLESDSSAANAIVSTSRDKKVIVWKVDDVDSYMSDNRTAGYALRSLSGHSQPISDLSLSSNAKYAISGSWDTTLRLWDLEAGKTLRTFKGHTSDVFSVALSPDNRQIVSGSRDRTIKLWNTMAECKYTIENDRHEDWVSCVRFSPSNRETLIVSCGWDKVVKVWDLKSCELRTNLVGHKGPLHTVTISPDGSLCASGGKDGVAMLWDVNEGNHLYSLAANSSINSLCFSPCHYWLCVATDNAIKIWNLEEGKNVLVNLDRSSTEGLKSSSVNEKVKTNRKKGVDSGVPWCVSLAWSADGRILYAGSTDGRIYVYEFAKDLNF